MTTFESAVKTVNYSDKTIFQFLTNFKNYENLLPADKITHFSATETSFGFSIKPLGRFLLQIVGKEEFKTIKMQGEAKVNFDLVVDLVPFTEEITKLKVTINADLNPFEKMIAAKPIQSLVDSIADQATQIKIA